MLSRLMIRFKNSDSSFELDFQIRRTDLAQRWAQKIQNCLSTSVSYDRERLTSFDSPDIEIEEYCSQVIQIIEQLRILHPEIEFGPVNFSELQKEVNRLHVQFADRHIVRNDLSSESLNLWTRFNYLLHQLELVLRTKEFTDLTQMNQASLIVSFHDPRYREELKPSDFQDAILNLEFGGIYINYCQIGRHFYELFNSQDINIPDAHIQPFKLFSADFNIWFGTTTGPVYHRMQIEKVKEWFLSNPRFAELGYRWNPQELGLGYLPVARMSQGLYSLHEFRELQAKIKEHRFVESIRIE